MAATVAFQPLSVDIPKPSLAIKHQPNHSPQSYSPSPSPSPSPCTNSSFSTSSISSPPQNGAVSMRSSSPAGSPRTTVPPSSPPTAASTSSTLSPQAPNFHPSFNRNQQPFQPQPSQQQQMSQFQHPPHVNLAYPYQIPFPPHGNPHFFNFPSQGMATPPGHQHSLQPQQAFGDPNLLMNMAYHQQAQHLQMQMRVNNQPPQPPSPSGRNSSPRQRTGSESNQQNYYFDTSRSPFVQSQPLFAGQPLQPPPFVTANFTPPIPSPQVQAQGADPFSAYRPTNTIRPLPNQPLQPQPSQSQTPTPDWKDWKAAQYSKTPAPPPMLYAQHTGRGSTSSVGSDSSGNANERSLPPGAIRVKHSMTNEKPQFPRSRTDSQSSTGSKSSYRSSPVGTYERERTPSISSTTSSRLQPPKLTISNPAGVSKPSPLSQQAYRSDAGTGKVDFEGEKGKPRKTITGKLRRALSMSSLQQMEGGSDSTTSPTTSKRGAPPNVNATRRFGLLNSKMNGSTDNISISSTVSSASVMIRKIGNMARLGRRGSLMSLGSMFNKDKDSTGDDASEITTTDTKGKRKDKKKSTAAIASVSHVTAELEKGANRINGMTPAEALVKQHQAMYAEQEAAAAAESHRRSPSAASSVVSTATTVTVVGKSSTAEDAIDIAKARAAEKEKEKLKSRKGRWGFGSFGGSSSSNHIPINPPQHSENLRSEDGEEFENVHPTRESSASQVEVLSHELVPYQGDEAQEESEDYEDDSHLRPHNSHLMPHRQPTPQLRGILKKSSSVDPSENEFAPPNALGNRNRANSYDAPQPANNAPSERTTLVQLIPSEAQVDGIVPSESRRQDQSPKTVNELYGNANLNASAPVLQHIPNSVPPARAATSPVTKRNISFATHLSFHTTWPAAMYDRKSEPGTCAHLTPALAQRIKEELNAFKMEEMEVHHMSRCYTHFFV